MVVTETQSVGFPGARIKGPRDQFQNGWWACNLNFITKTPVVFDKWCPDGMCKIVTWLNHWNRFFHKISIMSSYYLYRYLHHHCHLSAIVIIIIIIIILIIIIFDGSVIIIIALTVTFTIRKKIILRIPVDSIREAMLTVSPKRQ